MKRAQVQAVEQSRAEISSNRVPVAGAAGLVFAVGSCLIFLFGLPQARWFLLGSILVGAALAAVFYFWHEKKQIEITDIHDI